MSVFIDVVSKFNDAGIIKAQKELDKLADASRQATQRIADGVMNAGKSLTFGLTLPIVGAGVVATKWASDAAESANKVNVVFGEQAAVIGAWAKDSERAFGLSEGQANNFFGSVGTMLKGFGIDSAVLPDMSRSVLTLAADLGSFHNLDTAAVLDMISASFRGEYDSIQRVIPTLRAAEVQTRALAMTGKESADSLSAQEKALATYQLLLEGAGPATGDFARTQDGAANSTRIATAQIKSAGEQIGSVFLPIVSKIAAKIGEWADKFQGLDGGTQKIILVVAGLAAGLGPLLIALGAAAKAVLAINAAMALLAANPIVLAITAIVIGIAALVAGLIYAYNNFEVFRAFVDQTWDAIQTIITFAWENVIKPIWDAIVWYVQNLLIPYYKMLWEIVKFVFEAIGAYISFVWGNIISPVFNFIKAGIETLIDAFFSIKDGISGAFSTIYDIVTSPFRAAFNFIANAWNNTVGKISFEVPDWVPGLGGKGFSIPKIPTFASGGFFDTAVSGGVGLAVLHDNEMILNPQQQAAVFGGRGLGGQPVNIVINTVAGDPIAIERVVLDAIGRARLRGATALVP